MQGTLKRGLQLVRLYFYGQLVSKHTVIKIVKEHDTHFQFVPNALCIHNRWVLVGVLIVVNARESRYQQICPVLVHEPLNLGVLI
jgi:hypothetical protein